MKHHNEQKQSCSPMRRFGPVVGISIRVYRHIVVVVELGLCCVGVDDKIGITVLFDLTIIFV